MRVSFLMLLLTAALLLPHQAEAQGRRMGQQPAPRLIAPADDTELSGQSELEFRWSDEGDRAGLQYYDFKLYRGPKTVEAAQILHEKVPPGQAFFRVPADRFETGGTYAWSVRRVGSQKGRSSFSVFKIR